MAAESCPVCGSANARALSAYRAHHAAFAGLQRARCDSCGLGFAWPMPGPAVLDEYNARYFATAHGEPPRTAVGAAFFSAIARLRLAHVERFLAAQSISVASVLEVGPGPGFFARCWLARRPETRYMAVETDRSCQASLRQIGVELVDLPAVAQDRPQVDLAVLSHVLEHVPDPLKFLTDTTRHLRKGGALFIEVPCLDYEHKSLDEPHLLFFDKKPMQHLLHQCGFDTIEVSYHGETIDRLRAGSRWRAKWIAVRS